jgi:hypothetical protein
MIGCTLACMQHRVAPNYLIIKDDICLPFYLLFIICGGTLTVPFVMYSMRETLFFHGCMQHHVAPKCLTIKDNIFLLFFLFFILS